MPWVLLKSSSERDWISSPLSITKGGDWISSPLSIAKGEDWISSPLSDPVGTLREAGLVLEDFVQVEINRDPNAFPVLRGAEGGVVIYELPLPPKPPGLDDEELRAWVEGRSQTAPANIAISC
ncbi:hypothetical protein ACE1CB_06995 [Aerosakkonema sp. BLCC-F2]